MKTCNWCKAEKGEGAFSEGRKVCTDCRNERRRDNRRAREACNPEARAARLQKLKQYASENKDRVRRIKEKWAEENKEKLIALRAAHYRANSEEMRLKAAQWKKDNPERRLENNRRWAALNPEKARDSSRRNKARRLQDPSLLFSERVRNLIGNSLRKQGYTKRSRTHEILGCDFATLAAHLESQFQPGMSWENRGEWHIDHRVPLATAKTEEDVIRLNHYTNLQPLWAADNLAKGARLDWAPPTTGE